MREADPVVVVVMGVSGSGKTTIATRLAARLGWAFQEGDALHPPANIAKMHAGIPLDDDDRAPWLAAVAGWIDGHRATGESGVITCSALRRRYRDVLRREGVVFAYLEAPSGEIGNRLEHRHGHFMPAALLPTQLDALEPPGTDELAVKVDARGAPEEQVDAIVTWLERRAPESRAG